MADNRFYTFLKLCELMNYRKTAAELNMTQPAVTQQIHYLEDEYGCSLFTYHNRILRKTPECLRLERYARSVLANEKLFLRELKKPGALKLSIGATKTIGDYTIEDKIMKLLRREDISLELMIDNTENLLARLNAFQLDLLLVEGFIDKDAYGHRLIRQEELLGICAKDHPFAGKDVPLSEILKEHLILRETGSGTRAVFEDFIHEKGYSTESFTRTSQISSFRLIEKAVSEGCGISFVYRSIADNSRGTASFRISDRKIFHEFNYVFLKNACVEPYLELLENI